MEKQEQDAALRLAETYATISVNAHFKQLSEADKPGVINQILVKVWRTILPQFNPRRGSLENYLQFCIKRLTLNELDKTMKRRHRKVKTAGRRRRKLLTQVQGYEAPSFDSNATDRLAEQLDTKLSPAHARTLADFQSTTSVDELTIKWNCSRAAADARLSRLRKAVRSTAADSADQRAHTVTV